LVYANSKEHWNSLPPGAREIQGQAGGTIPIVLVTTADAAKGIHAIAYKTMSEDMRKAVRDLKTKLEGADVLGGGVAAKPADTGEKNAPAAEMDDDLLAETQEWTNAQGNKITAGVRAVNAGNVLFVMPDGKVVSYPLAKLSDESREKIEELAK
jgi:hypothetical protein